MPDPTSPPPRPRRWGARLAQAAAGLLAGLVIAEGVFHLRDHGAFPHLNLYVADARLGVRLRPGASERIAFGGNPVTHVRINGDGFRGAELPPPSDGEIVVVGDSQVFGLGVEEGETASAELERILAGPRVINAGVPTYGPLEYAVVIDELLARRRPAVVVYVINLANDLFEAIRPNIERHAVWDGWAVRRETAPERITPFPGRELLFRESHLFFALRSLWYARGPALDDRGFASEGTGVDLVGAAAQAGSEHARAEEEAEAQRKKRDAEIADTTARELAAEIRVEDLALDTFDYRGYELGEAYKKSRDNPGDIVVTAQIYVEGSRGAHRTAQYIVNGAEVRRLMEERIRAFAELAAARDEGRDLEHADPAVAARWEHEIGIVAEAARRGAKQGRAHPLVRTLEEREALKKHIEDLRRAPAEIARAWSPMTPLIRQAKAACDAHGARLLVVALPMDVQVSPAEWAKYGAEPVDMAPTKILLDDLVTSAEALGAQALDATPALADAEPGAFLHGDIHMTPRGQRALAVALAAKVQDLLRGAGR